jgi:hypothetical protein
MNNKMVLTMSGVILIFSTTSFSSEYKKNDPALTIPECKIIEEACLGAGFIRGQWKVQNGLWKDCVNPISKGQDTLSSKSNQILKVTPELTVAAKSCLEKRPKNPKNQTRGKL